MLKAILRTGCAEQVYDPYPLLKSGRMQPKTIRARTGKESGHAFPCVSWIDRSLVEKHSRDWNKHA